MSDPLGEQEQPEIKTIDDCWAKVGEYNFEELKYPAALKEKFPEFAADLMKVKQKDEKQKGVKLGESNSLKIGDRTYWWSQFMGKMQYLRSGAGSGAGSGGRPSYTTIYEPINVGVFTASTVVPTLLQKAADDIFKHIIFTDRNPETKQHEFVVETYKVTKFYGSTKAESKKEEPKDELE